MHAAEFISATIADDMNKRSSGGWRGSDRVEPLLRFLPLRDEIESFWRDPEHQGSHTWTEHRDINDVMLATSLAPEGFWSYTRHRSPTSEGMMDLE